MRALRVSSLLAAAAALSGAASPASRLGAQQFIKELPGYARYQKVRGEIPAAVRAMTSGRITAEWAPDGKSFEYTRDGQRYRYDVSSKRAAELGKATGRPERFRGRQPARGRQFTKEVSPDSSLVATYRNRNVYVSAPDGSHEVAVTTDGSVAKRIKYGTASWVYGEELRQRTAMWWSPDGKKLAYYRFDESDVPDYYLQEDQVGIQDSLNVEAYPKAGKPNPVVDLYVYDVATGRSTRMRVRDGKPFANDVVGYYVYQIGWTPDGSEITFNRTNRRQNILEFTACNPSTGACRVVVREAWPSAWVDNHPPMRYLADGKRFLWISERTGFANIYLYDLSGKLLRTITHHDYEVASIERVDEKDGTLWYTARDGDNPMKLQLHRVGLDGRNDVRLTDPAFDHTVSVAPDGKHFVDVAQTHDSPPVTSLRDARGRTVAQVAAGDSAAFHKLGLQRAELFTFTAADGVTKLYGLLYKPSNFDPSKKYPLLVSVYAGPKTNGASEVFQSPDALTEYGFLVAKLDSRSAAGRGKRFLDAIYEKLGTVEIDDQAAGVRALDARPYVDGKRVGIFGTSYGGYASVMAILRHPDVFAAASAASPVTDWRNYDSIYTERYMWLPQDNKAGYDAGSAMTYAKDLKGRLMLYYGTADNNVHPSNMMQLVTALQEAGKSFDVQVGPDRGHSRLNVDRMMEFFIENLVQPLPAVGETR